MVRPAPSLFRLGLVFRGERKDSADQAPRLPAVGLSGSRQTGSASSGQPCRCAARCLTIASAACQRSLSPITADTVAPLTRIQVFGGTLLALGDGACHVARLQSDLTLVTTGRRPLAPVSERVGHLRPSIQSGAKVSTLLPSRVIEKWMMNGGSLTLPERTTNAVLDASVRTSKPSVKSLGRFWH
jgi:hypothetical protein